MKIIAIERELSSPASGNAALYEQEARAAYALYLEGALREIYLTEENNAILLLECESPEAARRMLGMLPLVLAGITAFDIHVLRPYPGYGRLMH